MYIHKYTYVHVFIYQLQQIYLKFKTDSMLYICDIHARKHTGNNINSSEYFPPHFFLVFNLSRGTYLTSIVLQYETGTYDIFFREYFHLSENYTDSRKTMWYTAPNNSFSVGEIVHAVYIAEMISSVVYL